MARDPFSYFVLVGTLKCHEKGEDLSECGLTSFYTTYPTTSATAFAVWYVLSEVDSRSSDLEGIHDGGVCHQ